MPDLRTRDRDAGAVISRFLLVTLGGYLAALAGFAITIWLAAMPVLKEMNYDTLAARAEAKAQALADRLDDRIERVDEVARHPAVMAYAAGEAGARGSAEGAMEAVLADGALSVTLAAPDGRVLRQLLRAESARPPPAAEGVRPGAMVAGAYRAARALGGDLAAAPRLLYRPIPGGQGHVLVTRPVRAGGRLAGVVSAEFLVEPADLAAGETEVAALLATPFAAEIVRAWRHDDSRIMAAPVAGTGLHMLLLADYAAVEAQAGALVARIFGLAVLPLAVPFVGMALFGRGAISRPYLQLLDSRRALEARTREASELAQIVEGSHDAVVVTDAEGRIVFANDAFERLTGYGLDDCRGRAPGALLQGPGTDARTVGQLARAIRRGAATRVEILNYRRDRTPYWISLSVFPIRDDAGEIVRFGAISTDITAQKRSQNRLERVRAQTERMALHDELTGLPNRRRIDLLLSEAARPGQPPRTLVRIDLDHFKAVNDTHGHAAGDFVLREVAAILARHAPEGDVAARIGGDEFVILMGPGRSAAEGERLARDVQAQIGRDMIYDGNTCRVGSSFGIASALDGIVANDGLLVAADAALYVAKERGRNTSVVYTPVVHRAVTAKRNLATEIERAIEREEFDVQFQPQYDAATRELAGVEALGRWRHPVRGLLTPDQFLPVARQLSMLDEIDRIIYRKGLEAIAALGAAGRPVPKVSFNVGVSQIENTDLIRLVSAADLGRTRVAFEILESVLVEEQSARFAFQVDLLRETGIEIEVDDFGSGHASVIGLMQLRPDTMKLDQRLIVPIVDSRTARSIVRATIAIGKALGIRVTAEGVETDRHASLLEELGCDTLQGFHFARPMDIEDLGQHLGAHPGDAGAAAARGA